MPACTHFVLCCRPKPKANVSLMAWSSSEASAMRRHVLLACLEKLKDRSSLPWARTAAHLALQAAKTHRDSFCEAHQPRLQALVSFLQKAKANVNKVRCSVVFFGSPAGCTLPSCTSGQWHRSIAPLLMNMCLQGPSTAQLKQDTNAFETARKEWGSKAVSSRGKVGAMGGDIQNAAWLG